MTVGSSKGDQYEDGFDAIIQTASKDQSKFASAEYPPSPPKFDSSPILPADKFYPANLGKEVNFEDRWALNNTENPAEKPVTSSYSNEKQQQNKLIPPGIPEKAGEWLAWLTARSGMVGATAAQVADPVAWGLTLATIPIWASTELNKGEKPYYKLDEKTGKYVPTEEQLQHFHDTVKAINTK